jgi:elongation factor Ts
MAQITAAEVKALRDRTGLPMMDCKQALAESGGDADKAIEILRKRGAAAADKRAERETGQGCVAAYIDADKRRGAIIEFRCESAPVANNPEFRALGEQLARAAAFHDGNMTPEDVLRLPAPDAPSRTCQDLLNDLINKIRENMTVTRVARLSGRLAKYVHFNGQVGVLLQLEGEGGDDELAADLCMHITAMKPLALRREDVEAAVVEKEREIAREQAKATGKPETIIEKIVDGKVNRWYSENVLLDQDFANPDKFKGKISKLLKQKGDIRIAAYHRLEVGGG